MKTLFTISMIFLMTSFIHAQVNQEWVKTYNDATQTKSMAFDHAGNVYVGGNYFNGTTNPKKMLLLKYNSSGDLLQTILDSSAIILKAMTIDGNDNIIMAGMVNGSLGVLVKYDASGQLVWTQNVTGSPAFRITTDENNNLYIISGSFDTNSGDITTTKFGEDGSLLWTVTYNGPYNGGDMPRQIYYKNGFVYVTGSAVATSGIFEIITIKYNAANGSKLWGVLYTHADKIANIGVDMVADANNNVYVTGQIYNKGKKKNTFDLNWVTLKYNSAGVQQWAAIYDGNANDPGDNSGNDAPDAMLLDNTGNVYVTGTSYTTSTIGSAHYTSLDMTTVKYSNAGSQLWVKTYDGSAHSTDEATAITGDGANIYLTGRTIPSGSTAYNATTIKYNASGSQQWVINYDVGATLNAIARNIGTDGSGNIYVAGSSQAGSVRNTFLIKYSQGTPPNANQLQARSIGEEVDLNKVKLFPNPVQSELKIESTHNNLLGNITVYDVSGSIVYKTFANDTQVTIDVHNMPAGIYYLKADHSSVKSFVKQ